MAHILNIETSTEVCSVSIARNGEITGLKENPEGLKHSELLTVYINDLLSECRMKATDLDAVAVSKGPGSYTGLRIGVSVAKGICYGLDVPLIALNSLEILGEEAARNGKGKAYYCPMIDARRMEVYTALYDQEGKEVLPVTAEIIDENFLASYLEEGPVEFLGNGAAKCKSIVTHSNAFFVGPDKTSAQFMHNLSYKKYKNREFEDLAYFEPFYLKNFVATIPKVKGLK